MGLNMNAHQACNNTKLIIANTGKRSALAQAIRRSETSWGLAGRSIMVLSTLGADTMVRSSKMPFMVKNDKSSSHQFLLQHPIRKSGRMQILPDRTARARPNPPHRVEDPPSRYGYQKHAARPQHASHLTQQWENVREVFEDVEGGDEIEVTRWECQRLGDISDLKVQRWTMLTPVGNRAFGKIESSHFRPGPRRQVRRQPPAMASEIENV